MWSSVPAVCSGRGSAVADRPSSTTIQASDTAHSLAQSQATNDQATALGIRNNTAIIGHRDKFGPSPDLTTGTCPIRIRLTSAEPFRLGALWRLLRVPVFGGFETVFTFQVSSLTRAETLCTYGLSQVLCQHPCRAVFAGNTQVTDQARSCTEVKDRQFHTQHHKVHASCAL
jgi:hypothetical protein